jgi:ElaB/YqjD/DUF883 family membrane-anchored ribosome-binding protein
MPDSGRNPAPGRYPTDDDFGREWVDDSGTSDTPHASPEQARKAAASLADGVKEAASATAEAVKRQASAVAGEVGHELGKTAEQQAARGADAIRAFARAIEAAGAELEQQSPEAARYAADGAQKMRSLSDDLAQRDAGELIAAATDFARSQPFAFIGAAIATGFALGRFLKSSARHEPTLPAVADSPLPDIGRTTTATGFDAGP